MFVDLHCSSISSEHGKEPQDILAILEYLAGSELTLFMIISGSFPVVWSKDGVQMSLGGSRAHFASCAWAGAHHVPPFEGFLGGCASGETPLRPERDAERSHCGGMMPRLL